jgi:hypothetical protein
MLMGAASVDLPTIMVTGGLPALVRRLDGHLVGDALTVTGRTVTENIATAECHDDEVVRPIDKALGVGAGTAVLRGNLAPQGAIIKQAAASPHLMRPRGRARLGRTADPPRPRPHRVRAGRGAALGDWPARRRVTPPAGRPAGRRAFHGERQSVPDRRSVHDTWATRPSRELAVI